MTRIGIDFGGTKIEAAALSAEGEIVARQRTPNPGEYDAAVAAVRDLVAGIEAEAGVKKEIVGKLLFEEFERPMIVNATKRDALIAVFGDDIEALRGKKVTLFPASSTFEGKPVPAIGMKIPKAKS